MDVIWVKREGIYFCGNGWTGSISLIKNEKLDDWRRGYLLVESVICGPLATDRQGLRTIAYGLLIEI